ncbi:MAG: hypothetical protein K2Y01_00150 [Rhabdochlamydiaceae bacterium]|nr:hypothetical protein [Rhabdochlamydiaceae bacterium]
MSDITYVWTAEGWLYVSVVLDLFSKKIVGLSLGKHIRNRTGYEGAETGLIPSLCPNQWSNASF